MFYACAEATSTSLIAKFLASPLPGAESLAGETCCHGGPMMAKIAAHLPEAGKMSVNAPASSGAGLKAAALARMPRRLAFAVSLTVLLFGLLSGLLSGAAVSASGEDGPMASAPLPPPLPAAPPPTGSQQPQGEPSSASRRVPPQSRSSAGNGMHAAYPHKRNRDPRHDRSAHAARGQKRDSQWAIDNIEHRETYPVPRVASAMVPPPAPLPFAYRYIPGAPPAYGYAPLYPPPWPPGPALPR